MYEKFTSVFDSPIQQIVLSYRYTLTGDLNSCYGLDFRTKPTHRPKEVSTAMNRAVTDIICAIDGVGLPEGTLLTVFHQSLCFIHMLLMITEKGFKILIRIY